MADKTRAKIQVIIANGGEDAEKLFALLDLAEAVKPEISQDEKDLTSILSRMPKGNPAREILEGQLKDLQAATDVDPMKAMVETCRVLGKPLANGVAVAIRKLVGDVTNSMWVKVGSPKVDIE